MADNVKPKAFIIECPVLKREARAEFSDFYTTDVSFGCSCCGGGDYETEIYLKCECGKSHDWVVSY